ncbi:helix-turn-helix domain-containing protein [Actinoplanes sp. NPDC051411]|uniref:helix-turn-helix domain-containing protein n=1 Tax=Actinoplanes sp. NPDC051411 TaxID=3155522 RepID=UPI003441CE79
MGSGVRRNETVHELALQLGIADLEKFLRACIAISSAGHSPETPPPLIKVKYTVEEAADILGVSSRWLFDQCRAERVAHTHLARHRFFTGQQLMLLLRQYEVKPEDKPDPELERIRRQVERGGARRR